MKRAAIRFTKWRFVIRFPLQSTFCTSFFDNFRSMVFAQMKRAYKFTERKRIHFLISSVAWLLALAATALCLSFMSYIKAGWYFVLLRYIQGTAHTHIHKKDKAKRIKRIPFLLWINDNFYIKTKYWWLVRQHPAHQPVSHIKSCPSSIGFNVPNMKCFMKMIHFSRKMQ